MVRHFFNSGEFDQNANRTFIILIPKKDGANKLEDFRSINLCNVRNKIIAKIFVIRIRPLLAKCISPVQGAFLPSKRTKENIIIVKVVLHVMSQPHRKKKYCPIKVAIKKAYDSLSWAFL